MQYRWLFSPALNGITIARGNASGVAHANVFPDQARNYGLLARIFDRNALAGVEDAPADAR